MLGCLNLWGYVMLTIKLMAAGLVVFTLLLGGFVA